MYLILGDILHDATLLILVFISRIIDAVMKNERVIKDMIFRRNISKSEFIIVDAFLMH
jgi:hypothetical protein